MATEPDPQAPAAGPARVALVTGASSGIGRALSLVLARDDGYAVGLVARRQDLLENLAEEIRGAGGRALVHVADVGDREAMHRAVAEIERQLGAIDLLVANAGIAIPTPALAFDASKVEREFRVNVLGVCYGIEAVVPGMRRRGRGHIVAVSSLAARRGFPGSGGYCASKIALTRLMESLRLEWKDAGIRATTIHPGFVESEITDRNTHPMPFFMSAEKGARLMARAIRRGRKVYDFPWQTAWLTRVAARLPDGILRRLRPE